MTSKASALIYARIERARAIKSEALPGRANVGHCLTDAAPEARAGTPFVIERRYAAGRTVPSAIIAAFCIGGSIATSVLVTLTHAA